jgi:Gas vesicle synthesis protein GvpO
MSERVQPPDGRGDGHADGHGDGDRGGGATKGRLETEKAVLRAVEQLATLLGATPERVIGVEPRDDGWRVRIEVVELERVPDTTSVLASYDVDVDGDGGLIGYRRTSRYTRAQTEGG